METPRPRLKECLFLISETTVASFGPTEATVILKVLSLNGSKELSTIMIFQNEMLSLSKIVRCAKNTSSHKETLYEDSKNLLVKFFESLKPNESFWVTKRDVIGENNLRIIREKLVDRNNAEVARNTPEEPPKEILLERSFARFF